MAAAPLLNFAPYNPMDSLIQNAIGVYQGIGQGRGQQLQNQTNAAKLPYIGQLSAEELRNKQLINQYYGPTAEAGIAQSRAGANLSNASAQQIQFLLSHPGLLGGDAAKTITALNMEADRYDQRNGGGRGPSSGMPGPMNPIPSYNPGGPDMRPTMANAQAMQQPMEPQNNVGMLNVPNPNQMGSTLGQIPGMQPQQANPMDAQISQHMRGQPKMQPQSQQQSANPYRDMATRLTYQNTLTPAQQKYQEEQSGLHAKGMNELRKTASSNAQAATTALESLTHFDEAYNRANDASYGKYIGMGNVGPFVNDLPLLGGYFQEDKREADKYSKDFATQLAKVNLGTSPGIGAIEYTEGSKPGTNDQPAAERRMVDNYKMRLARVREQPQLVEALYGTGRFDEDEINKIWNDYNMDKPYYLPAQKQGPNGQIEEIPGGNLNTWQEYIMPLIMSRMSQQELEMIARGGQ